MFRVVNFEAVSDNKINVMKEQKFVYQEVENIGKGENAGYQHFLLPQFFSIDFFHKKLRLRGIELKVNPFPHNDTF